MNLHRLREKALCTGGLERLETASDDTANGWMPVEMSSEVHTNTCVQMSSSTLLSFVFNIIESHKQNVSSLSPLHNSLELSSLQVSSIACFLQG